MQQLRKTIFLAILGLLFWGSLSAHGERPDLPGMHFVENKGQWEPQVRFALDLPQGRMFLENDGITYAFCDISDLHERLFEQLPGQPIDSLLDCHAYKMQFLNGNPDAAISASNQDAAKHNYFLGNDPSKWASDVGLYRLVRYHEIYPGIDFVIYSDAQGVKYDFELSPGADPAQIALRYEGADRLLLEEGQLAVITSIGTFREDAPIAYQSGNSIACRYSLDGNELHYDFPQGYDVRHSLRIDPTLIFSTFTGSVANNFGFSATYSIQGHLYAGGIAYAQQYPVTTGAFQTNFGGVIDMSITKFSPTGSHLYSTFIGGDMTDQPHSMIEDPFGNLCIYGRTQSSNYPVSPGAFDTSFNGDWDIVVTKITPQGNNMFGSTYVGGDGPDGLNISTSYARQSLKYNYGDDSRGEIVTDELGNLYVATCTQSSNFPTSFGCFQSLPLGGQDAVVFKINPLLTNMTWGTRLGGSGNDAAYSLKPDGDGGVYVTGGTASSNFPTTPGTVTPNYQGNIDGFLTHVNNTGAGLLASTFIGTSDYNQCYFIEVDGDGDVYVLGQKIGSWPISPGVWNTGQGGQFIQKLTPNFNSVIYSTVIGTTNNDINFSPTAFLVDVCEYVYVSGWGGGTNFSGTTTGLPVTPGTIQSTTDGSDLYLIVLRTDAATIDFATFMGGNLSNEHVDGGTSRFSKRAEIYQSVCAGCWANSDFPTTPGAFSSTNNSSGCNLACFKMELELEGVVADFVPLPAIIGCSPLSVNFQNQSSGNATGFFWNFDDPSSGASNTSTLTNPSHVFVNPGNYHIMLVAEDPNSCNLFDTTYKTVVVYAAPQITITPDTSVCEGGSITLQASGGQLYSWSPGTGLSNTNTSSPQASPSVPTTYTVIATNPGGCTDTAQVQVGIRPSPTASAGGGGFICPGDSVQISASGGGTYQWNNPASLSNPNAASSLAFPVQTTIYTVTVTSANGCTDTDTVSVQVSTVRAQAGPDQHICIGGSAQLNGQGGGTYDWQPPLGLSSTTIPNPIATPASSTTYGLTVTDQLGCQHTDSVQVVVHPMPVIVAGPDLLMCENDSLPMSASGGSSYQWQPPSFLSNPNSANPLAFPTSSISYVVTGTDVWGCSSQDTVNITVLPAPVAQAWGNQPICEDSSLQVFGSGGNSFSWSPALAFDNPFSPNPIVTLSSTTTLVLTVMATNGCDDTDSLVVPVTPTPVVNVNGEPHVCLGSFINLFAEGPGELVWNTGHVGPKLHVNPQASAWYTVQTTVDDCPSKPDSIFVNVDSLLPFADFLVSPDSGLLPLPVAFTNLSTAGHSYDWDFGDGSGSNEFGPFHTYQDTGRFQVQLIVSTEAGCTDTAYHKVIVGADFTIFVPTAFTPNGDGLNDYWNVSWIGVKEFHVMLFDRWGMMIYESFDPDFRWYGDLHQLPVQEGAYVFLIEASGHLGEKVAKTGTVTLMR